MTQQQLDLIPKQQLLEMLQSYSVNDIGRYAVARLLYRKYHVKSEAVLLAGGDKWVRCGDCDNVFDVGSIGYLHTHYVTFCGECRRDVSVIPAERPERDTAADMERAKNVLEGLIKQQTDQREDNTPQDVEIDHILIATKTPRDDVSFNLDNQSVYLTDRRGRSKRVNRTIYRVRFENGYLIGHVLNRKPNDDPWPRYQYSTAKNAWHRQRQSDVG